MLYHLEDISTIRKYEMEMRDLGYSIFDLSHWDCGDHYNKELLSLLKIENCIQPFKYVYSYEIESLIHNQVKSKIAKSNPDECCIFFPNSTLAIVNLCNFLQKNSLVNVCVLQPSYFTVEPCMRSFGINAKNLSLQFENNKFVIPYHEINNNEFQAVWITSPVFCTSTYFDDIELKKIQKILDNGIHVVCDESLCIGSYSIRNRLINTENLLTIHSPHKVISTNALKFSALVCDEKNEDFFDQWSDLFAGGLTNSSRIAINHFLSSNYKECLEAHISYTNKVKNKICKLITHYNSNNNYLYSHEVGQYITIYGSNVPYNESINSSFIKRIIYNTKTSLLPGYLEGFFENFGFCFRINLTLNEAEIINSLKTVLNYLNENYL